MNNRQSIKIRCNILNNINKNIKLILYVLTSNIAIFLKTLSLTYNVLNTILIKTKQSTIASKTVNLTNDNRS